MTTHPHGQHTQAHMPAHTAPKPGSTSATCARYARSCSLPQCLRLTWASGEAPTGRGKRGLHANGRGKSSRKPGSKGLCLS